MAEQSGARSSRESAVGSPAGGFELMDGLVQVAFAVTAVLNRVAAQHDLSLTQLRLLGILRDRRVGVSDLARYLGLEKSTVSGLIDRAVRRGLVERRADPRDGRAVGTELSREGLDLAKVIVDAVGNELLPMVGTLTAAERRRLAGLLAKLGLD